MIYKGEFIMKLEDLKFLKIAVGLSYFIDVVEGGKRDCKRNYSFELADFACSLD